MDIEIHAFSAPVGGEWPASIPCCFTPGKVLRYPLDKRLGEFQSKSGQYGKLKTKLYRLIDRSWRILVPTFADRGVSGGQCFGPPRPFMSVFYTAADTFSFS
jgi:hypothetical protein